MSKVVSLEYVDASILPARVLVLLSKYAQAVRDYDGVLIRISSLNVFRHVHRSFKTSESPRVRALYFALLKEVNKHLENQDMYTVLTRPGNGYLTKKKKSNSKIGSYRSVAMKGDKNSIPADASVSVANAWRVI